LLGGEGGGDVDLLLLRAGPLIKQNCKKGKAQSGGKKGRIADIPPSTKAAVQDQEDKGRSL